MLQDAGMSSKRGVSSLEEMLKANRQCFGSPEQEKRSDFKQYTVCPGSSDPPEKILNVHASENEVYTIF